MMAHSGFGRCKRIWWVGLLAALFLAGCMVAPEPDAADAAATQLPAAAAVVEPAAAPAVTPAAPLEQATAPAATTETAALALASPSELLNSYRVAASLVITSQLPAGALDVAGTQVQGDWLRSAGPFGFDVAFTLLNHSGDQRQELSLVAIDAAAAVRSEGAWATIRRDAALPYGGPDSLLTLPFVTRINRGENLGRTTIGGIPVTHYRLTDPATFTAAVRDLLPGEAAAVQNVLLEGWVADAGFVVKYFLQATLADVDFVDAAGNRLLVQQQIDASYLVSDVDAIPAIEWPVDAQPPGTIAVPGFVPNTFPLPAGATATPHLGAVEIRTAQGEAEVAAFYRAALAELGWSFAGELGFYRAGKDGQVINLTILPDAVSGETVVRVFVGTAE
jgi:hypothetical protein